MSAPNERVTLEAIDDSGQPVRPHRTMPAMIAERYSDGCFRTTAPDGSCSKDWMPDGYRYVRIDGTNVPFGGWRVRLPRDAR